MSINTKQLIDVIEWSALQVCMEMYRGEADQLEVLTYPKIATLFTSKTDDSAGYSLGLKKYQDRSTFLLATTPPRDKKSIPLVVVDVITDISEEDSPRETRRTFFKKRGVDYILLTGTDAKSIKILNHDKNTQNYVSTEIQNAFNNYQYECVMSFNPGKYTNYHEPITLLHEVSLDKIIGLDGNIDHIRSEIRKDADSYGKDISGLGKNYFKNTSVDGLCCVGTPNAVPLFAIEYDGKDHGGIKDIAKNWIFKKAGIPLLRIKRIHYDPGKPDLHCFSEINKRIVLHLLEQLLQADNYIARLLLHLRNETDNLDLSNKSHANIDTLTSRLEEYVARRKDAFKDIENTYTELLYKYEGTSDYQMEVEEDYLEREFLGENEQQLYDVFGAVPELKCIQRSEGLVQQALFKPANDERNEGLKVTCVECGPYNVIDATGQYEFDEIIRKGLLEGLVNKLDGIFLSGSPSLKEKLHALSYRRFWIKTTLNQHVYSRLINRGSRYWRSLGVYLFGVSKDNDDISEPDKELQRIEEEVRDPLKNLPDKEINEFLNEIQAIHKKLVSDGVGKFVLGQEYFNSDNVFDGLFLSRHQINNRRFLYLLDSPDELRRLWFSDRLNKK